ncbi:MAG TPA: porin family protein [Candidatus Cloacimonadota bacterium]|jgi:hypothetical protein|nr:porin family protein [Candidatus Cloacimonadota bacterium]HOG31303.1 porin family protein [Candidatus Cloacimonadota bacterium]HOR59381.1 porin family protein [Candidatus Cloacimonadota bacterium]HPB09542.1 porin family protein [Candidatus Cloacimonadota bacterium]HPL23692.1 porin family protein [Candidatus Cloacimonadota bacterium]
MKKLLIIGAVLLLCLGLAEAKTRNMYGVKGGVNIAKLQISETDGSVDTSTSLGAVVGVLMQSRPLRNLIVQPELLYSQKGSDIQDTDKLTISYITMPVLLKAALRVDSLRIQPLAGPEVGYALSAKSSNDVDYIDDLNRVNIGINLGVEFVYSTNYMMGVRYFHGLTELDKSAAKRPAISNNCWSVTAGYLF